MGWKEWGSLEDLQSVKLRYVFAPLKRAKQTVLGLGVGSGEWGAGSTSPDQEAGQTAVTPLD